MIASKPERRLTCQGTVLINDSIPARATWIRSSLLPFFEESGELFTSVQPFRFRRYSDIKILDDPQAVNGASFPEHATVVGLRYTLKKWAWEVMSSTPGGAAVTLLHGAWGIANVFLKRTNSYSGRTFRFQMLKMASLTRVHGRHVVACG